MCVWGGGGGWGGGSFPHRTLSHKGRLAPLPGNIIRKLIKCLLTSLAKNRWADKTGSVRMVARSSFQILVPCSGSLFFVPDITYRSITT